MICKRFKKFIIDYITGIMSAQNRTELMKHIKVCKKCKQELHELETTNKSVADYFQQAKIPYDNTIEEKIINRQILKETSILSLVKQLFFQFRPILKPIMITVLVIFLILLGIHEYTILQKNKIISKISDIIDIKQTTMDFVLLNNVAHISTLYIQSASDTTLIDEDEFYSDIKYSLFIYLMGQINEDYFIENQYIIENTLDKYAEEYFNFITENYKQIFI